MKSVIMGAVAAAVVAGVAILVFDYGGLSSAERFSAPGSTRVE